MNSLIEDTFNNWLELINRSDEELNRLNQVSENEFIKISSDFQNFFYRSKEIAKLSASISEILSGNEISETIEKLHNFLSELGKFTVESDDLSNKAGDTLNQIRQSIRDIYSPLDGFKKSVRLLNILGISIRIEDANLNSERNEFNILADEVTKLSEVIRSKLDITKKQTDNLDRIILNTLGNVSKLKTSQNSTNDLIINKTDQSLNELLQKKNGSAEVSQLISNSSKDISQKTGDIVSAIQFHDITRQQIEHVQMAFREIENRYKQGYNLTQDDDVCKLLMFIKEACELQTGQLQQSGSSIFKASGDIKNGLKSLEYVISQFISQTEKLTGLTQDNNSSVLFEIQQEIETVTCSMKENSDANKGLVETVSSSVETIEKISSLLNDIKTAGMDIEMISLNAIIKTAKLGKQGAALSVLASSIRDLSIDTADQIKNIDETINGITFISQELKKGITEKTNENVDEIEKMTDKLKELITIAGSADALLMNKLNEMISEGNNLLEEISTVLGSFNIEELFNYSFETVQNNLGEILREIYDNSISLECYGGKPELNSLGENYTMQTERAIHQQVIASRDRSSFQNISNGGLESNPDDNVELF